MKAVSSSSHSRVRAVSIKRACCGDTAFGSMGVALSIPRERCLSDRPITPLLYYCDESSQTDEYMAVGGLAIAAGAEAEITQSVLAINRRFGVDWSEIKWGNCKRHSGKIHKAYVDYLFELIKQKRAHFHVRFSHMPSYDHEQSGSRKKIDTVSKAYYQLIVHRPCRYYGNSCNIYVRADNGNCTSELYSQIDSMNSNVCHRYNYCIRSPVVHVECRDSKREPILQLMDVPLGALAAYRNGRHKHSAANSLKTQLSEYVFAQTGASSILGNTPLARREMSIWNAQPSR